MEIEAAEFFVYLGIVVLGSGGIEDIVIRIKKGSGVFV